MRVKIISLGLQYNLTGVDFTDIPIKAPRAALLSFFGTLVSEFGTNFLDWVYYGGEFRGMNKVFVLEDESTIVNALLGEFAQYNTLTPASISISN